MTPLEIIFGSIAGVASLATVVSVICAIRAGRRANEAQDQENELRERLATAQEEYNTRDLAVREAEVEVKKMATEAEERRAREDRLLDLIRQYRDNLKESGNPTWSLADLHTSGLTEFEMRRLINELSRVRGKPALGFAQGKIIEAVLEGKITMVDFMGQIVIKSHQQTNIMELCKRHGVEWTTGPTDYETALHKEFPEDEAGPAKGMGT